MLCGAPMRDLSPSEITQRQLDELIGNIDKQAELHRGASRRWALSLSIGNGGALVALGGKMLDADTEGLMALAMPSAWCFALGLIAAGILSPITSRRHRLARDVWRRHLLRFRAGRPLVEPSQAENGEGPLLYAEVAFEWTSAVLFVAGLLYPLAVLSHRYLTSGHGFLPPT